MSEPLLDGKVALVTGAGRGMGRASAVAYAREGSKVVVADVDSDGGNETVAQIEASGGEVLFVAADVSQPSSVEALITNSVEAFGAIDCACNNAAIELDCSGSKSCSPHWSFFSSPEWYSQARTWSSAG